MRTANIVTIFITAVLCAAGPATRPILSVDDVEQQYNDKAAIAKRAYEDETARARRAYDADLAKANQERLAELRVLLSRAMKTENADEVVAIKKKIDGLKSDEAKKDDSQESSKKIVYLCQATGSTLSVFGSMKQHLKESINGLSADNGQEFNVIFFYDNVYSPLFKDRPRDATDANKKMAMDFIDNAVSTGGEQPIPAIKLALKEKPEVIYLLTDGLTQVAKFDDVRIAFKQGNPGGKITVNCIFFQTNPDPKFEEGIKQIADDAHGIVKTVPRSEM